MSPDEARNALRHHYMNLTSDEFLRDVEAVAPDVVGAELELYDDTAPISLMPTARRPLPLRGYLASALSDLTAEQREEIFGLGAVVERVCAAEGIDLYQPGLHTDPVTHADVTAEDVFKIDHDLVLKSDLVIHLAHYASTGAGQELDFAFNALVPIILVAPGEKRVSRMVRGIPALKFEIAYADVEGLTSLLARTLTELRPLLEERKLSFGTFDANVVGEKVRLLREDLGLTREEVSTAVGFDIAALVHLEESPDRTSNPSLIVLRQLATVLRTTVGELTEPDFTSTMVAALGEWLSDRRAARFGDVSASDRNKIIRRVLYRVMDSLEDV